MLAVVLSPLLASPAHAAFVTPPPAKVINYMSFSQFGGGDVVFSLENAVPNCPGGLWLRATDPGHQQNVATLITAKSSGQLVQVYIYDDQVWTGSVTSYCYVYGIGLY